MPEPVLTSSTAGPASPERRRRRAARVARALGAVLALAGCAFVVIEARRVVPELPEGAVGRGLVVATAAGAVLYGALCLLLSLAWHRLLRRHAPAGLAPGLAAAHRSIARTAIAKYLPGNVLHLAGRHAWLRAEGVPHVTLGAAAVHEALSLLAVGGVLAGVGLAAGGAPDALRESVDVAWIVTLAVVLLVSAPALLAGARRLVPLLRREEPGGRPPSLGRRDVLAAHAAHAAFFLGCGVVLLGLLHAAGGRIDSSRAVAAVLLAQAVAWTAGFLTPGAPGGLGVREAVLVALLAPWAGAAPALLAAVAWRVATLGGEVVFLASSFGTPARAP